MKRPKEIDYIDIMNYKRALDKYIDYLEAKFNNVIVPKGALCDIISHNGDIMMGGV